MTEEKTQKNNIPPITFERNEFGLLNHIDYVFKEDGSVDWFAMIPKEYIVPNREKTEETDISLLDNSKLLILLDGFKKVAKIRGYENISSTSFGDGNFVSVTTSIDWIANYQDPVGATTIGMADATPLNTTSFAKDFLTTIAENRSFVRAVRNFLEIPVLGKDELGKGGAFESAEDAGAIKPINTLETLLKNNGIKFESFKNRMIRREIPGAADWNDIHDVPSDQVFNLIGIIQNILKAHKEKVAAQQK